MEISFGPGERVRLSNDLSDLTATLEGVSEADAPVSYTHLMRSMSSGRLLGSMRVSSSFSVMFWGNYKGNAAAA